MGKSTYFWLFLALKIAQNCERKAEIDPFMFFLLFFPEMPFFYVRKFFFLQAQGLSSYKGSRAGAEALSAWGFV